MHGWYFSVVGVHVPHFGEKDVVICIESSDIRSFKAQCSSLAQPLSLVKRVIEAGQIIGFSK